MKSLITDNEKYDCVGILDADYILYHCTYFKKEEREKYKELGREIQLEDCIDKLHSILKGVIENSGISHLVGTLTKSRSNTFRKKLNSEYKGNRKVEKADFFKECKDYMVEELNFIEVDNLEADDIVNIYYNHFDKYFVNSIRISPDKDVYNLEGTNFNPVKNEFKTINKKEASLFFWSSMIIGDSADNIKGIPRKGEKFVENFFFEETKLGISLEINKNLRTKVFELYTSHFGEMEGIEEFYKNYKMLKILEEKEEIIDIHNIKSVEDIKLW